MGRKSLKEVTQNYINHFSSIKQSYGFLGIIFILIEIVLTLSVLSTLPIGQRRHFKPTLLESLTNIDRQTNYTILAISTLLLITFVLIITKTSKNGPTKRN